MIEPWVKSGSFARCPSCSAALFIVLVNLNLGDVIDTERQFFPLAPMHSPAMHETVFCPHCKGQLVPNMLVFDEAEQ